MGADAYCASEVEAPAEIDVDAGAIESLTNVPAGWYIGIDNDPSWHAKVKADTIVGAASMSPSDLRRIQAVIRKNEFGDLKFRLSGSVSITKDFEKETPLPLQMSDFAIATTR